jgi:hypothetical protein
MKTLKKYSALAVLLVLSLFSLPFLLLIWAITQVDPIDAYFQGLGEVADGMPD